MSTLREASSDSWSASTFPTLEQINAGSLQRIADAVEVMSRSYTQLLDEISREKMLREIEEKRASKCFRRLAAARAVITRMKKAGGAR